MLSYSLHCYPALLHPPLSLASLLVFFICEDDLQLLNTQTTLYHVVKLHGTVQLPHCTEPCYKTGILYSINLVMIY